MAAKACCAAFISPDSRAVAKVAIGLLSIVLLSIVALVAGGLVHAANICRAPDKLPEFKAAESFKTSCCFCCHVLVSIVVLGVDEMLIVKKISKYFLMVEADGEPLVYPQIDDAL